MVSRFLYRTSETGISPVTHYRLYKILCKRYLILLIQFVHYFMSVILLLFSLVERNLLGFLRKPPQGIQLEIC